MSRRSLLALSAAATAFVLVLVGAVAAITLRPASPAPTAQGVPEDVVLAREAEYRRLIDEANARLRAQPLAPAPAPVFVPAEAIGSQELEHEEAEHSRAHEKHGRRHHEHDDG